MSDSRTVELTQRTYDFLSEHHWQDSKAYPTPDVLSEAESALGGVDEFLVDPICAGVAARVNEHDGELTDEEIGRLVVWADHMAYQARSIVEAAERVSFLARQSYCGCEVPVAAGGRVDDHDQYRGMWQGMVGGPTDA